MKMGPGTYWKMSYGGLDIYGEGIDSPYEEDMEFINESRKQGYIFGSWYSIMCPDGEMGSNHIAYCDSLTKEEFEEAQKSNWKV